jgi:hypothetical protein
VTEKERQGRSRRYIQTAWRGSPFDLISAGERGNRDDLALLVAEAEYKEIRTSVGLDPESQGILAGATPYPQGIVTERHGRGLRQPGGLPGLRGQPRRPAPVAAHAGSGARTAGGAAKRMMGL